MFRTILNVCFLAALSFGVPLKNENKEIILNMELPDFVTDEYKPEDLEAKDDFQEFNNLRQGRPLNPDDFEKAMNLSASDYVNPESKPNPAENGHYFEGDIIEPDLVSKNAMRDLQSRWPRGQIPYIISNDFDMRDRSIIARAMEEYHTHTCITFVPRTSQMNYIYIHQGEGCSSMVGMRGGVQQVSLGRGCVYVGTTVHEFMHATGFFHEQSRSDRDDYITIMWQNIMPGMQYNFAKYTQSQIQHLGENYDFQSVMHYGPTAFSRDNYSPTIVPKTAGASIGQRGGFSETDIAKIKKLYNCNGGMSIHDNDLKGKGMRDSADGNEPNDEGTSCRDLNYRCPKWAKKDSCDLHAPYMKTYCKKTCSFC